MQANEIRKVKGMTYAKEKIQITQAKYRSVKITIKFRSFLQGTKSEKTCSQCEMIANKFSHFSEGIVPYDAYIINIYIIRNNSL